LNYRVQTVTVSEAFLASGGVQWKWMRNMELPLTNCTIIVAGGVLTTVYAQPALGVTELSERPVVTGVAETVPRSTLFP
jgi:hypothetical protein